MVLTLNEVKDGESLFARLNPFKKGVDSKDLVSFSRQLATLGVCRCSHRSGAKHPYGSD